MIKIGKSSGSMKELDQVLSESHWIKVRVRLLDLDHNYIDDYSDLFVDGMVSVDADAEVTRALDLTLFDPFRRVHLDPDSPHRTSVYIADMISIVVIVMNSARDKVWEIPVFCGPVDDVSRDDVWIDIKCLGKESLSLTNLWKGRTWKQKQPKTDIIKYILRSMCGETRLSIPDRKGKTPGETKLNQQSIPWKVAKKLAHTMGFQLFYDGRGYAQMRRLPSKSVIRFGPKWVTQKPMPAYDLHDTINAVRVVGKKPKKAKDPVTATIVAKRSHPLSPWRIGRGGTPRYLWQKIEDDSLNNKKECVKLGKKVLEAGLEAGNQVTWAGLPHYRLQEGDPVMLDTEQYQGKFRARKFTIPLVAGDEASYGYLRRAKPRGGARGVFKKRRTGGPR